MKTQLGLLLFLLLPAVFIFSVTADFCSAAPIKVTDVSGKFSSTVEVIEIVGTSVKLRRADGSIVELPLTTFDRDSLIKILVEVGREDAPNFNVNNTITNTIGMKLNEIPAGTFLMGSPEDEEGRQNDEHQHKVTITKPFYMQTTEVTQGQWQAVMGTEPWKGEDNVKEGPDYPAVWVSWDRAVAYCKQLSKKEGKTYRLPTEAEWEYACRAGTETRWSFGDDEKAHGNYAWDKENTFDIDEKYAHQVGLKKPNAFGLYDMHGNVGEWCHDQYENDYYERSPEKDPQGPQGPADGRFAISRGGSWKYSRWTNSARRNTAAASYKSYELGFRVVRELD